MLPPLDIARENLKLAEYLAEIQRRQPTTAPPPSYAAAQQNQDQHICFDEDDDDFGPPPQPIVLNIDTSITIDGEANTIAIPTAPSGNFEDGPTVPSDSQTNNGVAQQLQQQRQVKSAQIASSIVSALKSCGVLDEAEFGTTRPIEINVSAGIRVTGSKNVVCSGFKRRPNMHLLPARTLGDLKPMERKRRAQSEPCEQSNTKKQNIQ